MISSAFVRLVSFPSHHWSLKEFLIKCCTLLYQKNYLKACLISFRKKYVKPSFYDVYEALNTNDHVFSIYLDFSKAFDKVSHQILRKFGIGGKLLHLLFSYLTLRTQCVKIDSVLSDFVLTACSDCCVEWRSPRLPCWSFAAYHFHQ